MAKIKKKSDDRGARSFVIWMTVIGIGLVAGYAAFLGISTRPHKHVRMAGGQTKAEAPKKVEPPAKVMDPVCRMMVTPPAEGHLEHRGKTYYFCSKSCKEDFAKEPEKYLKDAGN